MGIGFQSGGATVIENSNNQDCIGETYSSKVESSVTEKPSYLEDTTTEEQSTLVKSVINETVPYLIAKEGPNAHLFKF
jgi:hypothetical protein